MCDEQVWNYLSYDDVSFITFTEPMMRRIKVRILLVSTKPTSPRDTSFVREEFSHLSLPAHAKPWICQALLLINSNWLYHISRGENGKEIFLSLIMVWVMSYMKVHIFIISSCIVLFCSNNALIYYVHRLNCHWGLEHEPPFEELKITLKHTFSTSRKTRL